MFKRASKNELKTWMLCDLLLMALLMFVSISKIMESTEKDGKFSDLIWGIIFLFMVLFLFFLFYKMIVAFRTYEKRMEEIEKIEVELQAQREAEEKARLEQEELETKKFIEDYQRKVQEAEEQRKLEKEQKGNSK